MTDLLLATCEGLAASKDVRPLLTEIYARYAAIAAPFKWRLNYWQRSKCFTAVSDIVA